MDKPQITIIQEPNGLVSINASVPDRETLLRMLAQATLGILNQAKAEPVIEVASEIPPLRV